MSNRDDKYEDEEELTQVRSIIQQINEEKPSHTKKREVVVRPDGSKVIRVTKKRRVLMTEKEIKHRSRKHVVALIATLFLIVVSLVVYLLIKMASVSGEEYLQSRVEELRKAWGAESVRVVGAGISGTSLHISSIVAEFPKDCLVEQVEMGDLSAELDTEAFLREIALADVLRVKRVNIILRSEIEQMKMPLVNEGALWQFDRVECEDFSVSMGRGEHVRLALRNSTAHLYYPRKGRDNCVVAVKGGSLLVPNWQTIYVLDAKVHLSPVALEDLYLEGSVEVPSKDAEAQRSSLTLRTRIANGDRLDRDFQMAAYNMPFSDFTNGRFETFLTARTSTAKTEELPSLVSFTPAGPVFHGDFELEKIIVTSFPAITAMLEHVEPLKRRQYLPPLVESGRVSLSVNDGGMVLEMKEKRVATRDRLSLKGRIEISPENVLSGELAYGLPGILTRAEYTDGQPDPIFEDKGEWTWLSTTLKGFANKPDDNMAEIEARAAEARKSRPERMQFDALDVNKLSEQLKSEDALFSPDGAEKTFDGKLEGDNSDPFAEPKKAADDPFAPLSPF